MLGLLLLFFIGKYYVELANQFNKNKWLYAILGIATYYAGTIAFGFSLGLYAVIAENPEVLEMNNIVLGLMAIPFGILTTWILYTILKNNWKKRTGTEDVELLDNL